MTPDLSPPFVLVDDDGSVRVVRALPIELLKDRLTKSFTIFAREGCARPDRVLETRPTGKRIFGRDLLAVTFEWTTPEAYELVVLTAKLRAAIEADDDVYDQSRSHEEHLAAIDEATSFDDLVAAIDPP
jgi:hypothetical protein